MEEELEQLQRDCSAYKQRIYELECDLGDTQTDRDDYAAIVDFVSGHFPDAIKAFEVRERMEQASG
jgi:hypothetical protein